MRKLKFILFIAIFTLLNTVIKAQFHIGFKAGVNATKIDGKSFKEEFNYNYVLGGFAEIGFGNKFSINPEVLFNQTTSSLATDYQSIIPQFNSNQTKAKLNYLAIPILLDFRVFGPLHLQAGPQYSILMSSDKTLVQNGQQAFKKGDFSLVGGVQLQLSSFRVYGRYVAGMENINQISDQDKWKNKAFQIAVGYAF